MKFVCQGYRIKRELDEPVRINVDLVLVDIQPSDIDKMSEAMTMLEKILSGTFKIVSLPKEDEIT